MKGEPTPLPIVFWNDTPPTHSVTCIRMFSVRDLSARFQGEPVQGVGAPSANVSGHDAFPASGTETLPPVESDWVRLHVTHLRPFVLFRVQSETHECLFFRIRCLLLFASSFHLRLCSNPSQNRPFSQVVPLAISINGRFTSQQTAQATHPTQGQSSSLRQCW